MSPFRNVPATTPAGTFGSRFLVFNRIAQDPDAFDLDLVFRVTGTTGDDAIFGAAANDQLNGGKGSDYLSGEAGNDKLTGGAGGDVLAGGLGNDRFIFTAVADSKPGAGNYDTIDDFTSESDKIDLSAIDAKTSHGGNQAFGYGGQTSDVVANKITWYQDALNNETIIQADNNGNTVADLQIHLSGLHTLTIGDFIA